MGLTKETTKMDKIEWQVQNEYNLDKLNAQSKGKIEAHSFMVWKSMGRIVRKGEKQKAFTVTICTGTTMDGITGEDMPRYVRRAAYGFTKDQTEAMSALALPL